MVRRMSMIHWKRKLYLLLTVTSVSYEFPIYFSHVNKLNLTVFKQDLQHIFLCVHIAPVSLNGSQIKETLTECFLEYSSNRLIIPKEL